MDPIADEWLAKAEGDFATMQRELRISRRQNYDAVCFHAQQCVEKYLKGRLTVAGRSFGKTHDLVALLDAVLPAGTTLGTIPRRHGVFEPMRRRGAVSRRIGRQDYGDGRRPAVSAVPPAHADVLRK